MNLKSVQVSIICLSFMLMVGCSPPSSENKHSTPKTSEAINSDEANFKDETDESDAEVNPPELITDKESDTDTSKEDNTHPETSEPEAESVDEETNQPETDKPETETVDHEADDQNESTSDNSESLPPTVNPDETDTQPQLSIADLKVDLIETERFLTYHYTLSYENIRPRRTLEVRYQCHLCQPTKTSYVWWIDDNKNNRFDDGEKKISEKFFYKIETKNRGKRLGFKLKIEDEHQNQLETERYFDVYFGYGAH